MTQPPKSLQETYKVWADTPYLSTLRDTLSASSKNIEYYLRLFANSTWEEKPYGRKMSLGEGLLMIQIDPGKSTSLAAKPSDLDIHGLRAHPGVKFERITVLGSASGGQETRPSLHYRYRQRYSESINDLYFRKGSTFYSVQMDRGMTGYWHENVNASGRPIVLLIESGQMTYNEEVAGLNECYEDLEAAVYEGFLKEHGHNLSQEARTEIQKLDKEYAEELATLDEAQKFALGVADLRINPMEVIKGFEDKIGGASNAHAEKVKAVIGKGVDPSKQDGMFAIYKRECIDYFNPIDGMLSRYYVGC